MIIIRRLRCLVHFLSSSYHWQSSCFRRLGCGISLQLLIFSSSCRKRSHRWSRQSAPLPLPLRWWLLLCGYFRHISLFIRRRCGCRLKIKGLSVLPGCHWLLEQHSFPRYRIINWFFREVQSFIRQWHHCRFRLHWELLYRLAHRWRQSELQIHYKFLQPSLENNLRSVARHTSDQ